MLISEMEPPDNFDLERVATKADVEASERRLRVRLEQLIARVDTLAVQLPDQMRRLCDLVERLDCGR